MAVGMGWERAVLLARRTVRVIRLALITLFALAAHVPQAPASDSLTVEQIIPALCQVETGVTRLGMGHYSGKWSRGSAGEVSPFGITPGKLQDLGYGNSISRVHRDSILAESIARGILVALYAKHGSWRIALGCYNAGNNYRVDGRNDYPDRVLALATDLAHQPHQQTE